MPTKERSEWLNSLKVNDKLYFINHHGARKLAKVVEADGSGLNIEIDLLNGDIIVIDDRTGYALARELKGSHITEL